MIETVIHPLDEVRSEKSVQQGTPVNPLPVLVVFFVVIALVAGVGSGYLLTKVFGGKGLSSLTTINNGTGTDAANARIYGKKNLKLFPDSATGLLKTGGIDGEGTHHLERPGGASQNVYLTSSSIDLTSLVGKKVKVWGKTYAAQTAGWLMDVGYLEVE